MRRLVLWLTGGRPMRCIDYAFWDDIAGEAVWRDRDHFGRDWLATGAWSRFRARVDRAPRSAFMFTPGDGLAATVDSEDPPERS
jgi:hypothetical protein